MSSSTAQRTPSDKFGAKVEAQSIRNAGPDYAELDRIRTADQKLEPLWLKSPSARYRETHADVGKPRS